LARRLGQDCQYLNMSSSLIHIAFGGPLHFVAYTTEHKEDYLPD
jgi:hypothetical protein